MVDVGPDRIYKIVIIYVREKKQVIDLLQEVIGTIENSLDKSSEIKKW